MPWESEESVVLGTSTESKYQAMAIHHPFPMRLYCNNQATIGIASDIVFNVRNKHIEVRDEKIIEHICDTCCLVGIFVQTTKEIIGSFYL